MQDRSDIVLQTSFFTQITEPNMLLFQIKLLRNQKDYKPKGKNSLFTSSFIFLLCYFKSNDSLKDKQPIIVFIFQYISMYAATTAQQPLKSQKSKLSKIVIVIIVVLLISVAIFFAIWHFGTQTPHQQILHPFYSVFDQSPQHKELLKKLQKSKKSIVYGSQQAGLQQFSEHLANKMSKQKTVYLEEYHQDHFEYFQFVREVKVQINSLLNQQTNQGDWILQAFDNPLPETILADLIANNPNSKIVIITTNNTDIKGFKQFSFPALKDQDLQKSIAKTLKVKPIVAEILQDYFKTPGELYSGLNDGKFDHKELVGEHFSGLQNLSKEDKIVLQTLCSKGVAKSKKPSNTISSAGVVYYKGSYYWQTLSNVLNYELHSSVNCKNTAATEQILAGAQEEKLKFQEEQKKKEEQLKAEQARKEQEKKKKEQLQKAEAERKKQIQEDKKKQENVKASSKNTKSKESKQTVTPPSTTSPKAKKEGKRQK